MTITHTPRPRGYGRVAAIGVLCGSAAVAIYAIAFLYYVFFARLTFPMDLEWMEGGGLYHAHRLLHGQAIYQGIDAVFLPFPYPPGHTVALSILGVFRLDFWSGRLVSILAFTAFAAIVFRQVFLHLGRGGTGVVFGLGAVATVAVAYPVVNGWYDLIRVDTLMMALAAGGAAMVASKDLGARRLAVTALILTCAVFTKQINAFFIVWTIAFVLFRDRKAGVRLGLMTGGFCAVTIFSLQLATGGNFWNWIFVFVGSHPLDHGYFMVAVRLVAGFAPFVVLLPFAILLMWQRGWLRRRTVLWAGMSLVAVPAVLMSFAKAGGYVNNLMPLVMLVGPVTVMIVADLAEALGPERVRARRIVHCVAAIGISLFVWVRLYPADRFVPDAELWAKAERFNQRVATLEGGVLMPYCPFIPVRNGHQNEQWHAVSYYDMDLAGLDYDIDRNLDRVGARWLILPPGDPTPRVTAMRRRYRMREKLPPEAQVVTIASVRLVMTDILERLEDAEPISGAGSARAGTSYRIDFTFPGMAGAAYLGALSFSEGHGIPVRGEMLNLTPDALFHTSLAGGFVSGFSGTLDSRGTASGQVMIPKSAAPGITFFCSGIATTGPRLRIGNTIAITVRP